MAAKLAAVLKDPAIRQFICPSVDADNSVQALSPAHLQCAHDAITEAKAQLSVVEVADVAALLEVTLSDESIVLGSLRSGFFHSGARPEDDASILHSAARLLAEDNHNRFWVALKSHLLAGRSGRARHLLGAWVSHHVRHKRYPSGFGGQLLHLVRSLPPATRRLKTAFPLMGVDQCVQLGQFAAESDHQDVEHLFDASAGKGLVQRKSVDTVPRTAPILATDAAAAVDTILDQITAEALAQKIGLPIDGARAAYVLEDVIVDSHEAFNDTICAFYLALLQHNVSVSGSLEKEVVSAEALALLDRALADKGGAEGAMAEARLGVNGGMRLVLDVLTEKLKSEQQIKYVDSALKELMDPLDWGARVAFMGAFLERIGPHLPPNIRAAPPQRFARHYQTIVRTYAQSLDRVSQLLRSL